ncbi:MAG: response regulator transcription factor [Opitutaceae bacterium]|nr:response regulator transcription factor [Opitutaceae bacterium]
MKSKFAKKPDAESATPGATAVAEARSTPVSTKLKVLLVDDHPITRQGMKALVNQQPNLEVCGEADNAAYAIELVGRLQPDLAIVDIALKTTNGIELTKNIKVHAPNLPVLIVSMHDEGLYAERALRAGAMGYLMKQEASEKIIAAIQRLLQGEIYLSDKIKEKMLHRFVNKKGEGMVFSIDTLSDREMEVFQLIGNGYSTRQIAQKLNLSSKTIDSYREHLKLKLNLESGAELVRHAIQWARSEGTV